MFPEQTHTAASGHTCQTPSSSASTAQTWARTTQRVEPRGAADSPLEEPRRARVSGGRGHHPTMLPEKRTPRVVRKRQRRLFSSTGAGVAFGSSWRRIQKRLKAKIHCFTGSSDPISRHARFKDAQVWRAEPDWLFRRRGLRQVRLGHEPVRGEFLDWLKGR